MNPAIYIILGAPNSGRREIVYDLIDGGLMPDKKVSVYISPEEPSCPFDNRIARREHTEVLPWQLDDGDILANSIPEEVDAVFFVTEGMLNPVDQLEALKDWLDAQGLEVTRILTVVNCGYAFEHEALEAWYAACIHLSDCALLNYRDGLPGSWIHDFKKPFQDECYPCLFENVKNGRLANPPAILEPEARRISLAFDIIDDEDETPEEDIYFARQSNGARTKPIPELATYLA
mgnify:CR=1 FL=1